MNRIIIEKPARRMEIDINKKRKLVYTGKFKYYLLELDKPGVIDDNAEYMEHYHSKKEAKEKSPDIKIISWVELNERYKETGNTLSIEKDTKKSP